jgi:hypothetical protein
VDDEVELADVIWRLRGELNRAAWAGETNDLKFKTELVELELTVGIEKSRDPNVKVNFWVVEAGGNSQRKSMTTQTIKLTLRPVWSGDPDHPATISGPADEDER